MKAPLFDFDIALEKAKKYCAYQERCQWEVEKKLRDWMVDESLVDAILAELIGQGFINEERFSHEFARGRFRLKSWGRNKIRMELKMRHISDYSINKALESIPDEEYQLTLHKLITQKANEVRAKNSFEKKQKIARYLHGKGYEADLFWEVLNDFFNE